MKRRKKHRYQILLDKSSVWQQDALKEHLRYSLDKIVSEEHETKQIFRLTLEGYHRSEDFYQNHILRRAESLGLDVVRGVKG